jgi:hypothetical protein
MPSLETKPRINKVPLTEMKPIMEMKPKKKSWFVVPSNLPWGLLLIALIVIVVLSVKISHLEKNPNQSAEDAVAKTIQAVGKLVILPTNETPTVAAVTDLAPLKDQPFFANAKVGDKVLIYAKAGKAILYDPQANKVVEIAPINISAANADVSNGLSTSSSKKK